MYSLLVGIDVSKDLFSAAGIDSNGNQYPLPQPIPIPLSKPNQKDDFHNRVLNVFWLIFFVQFFQTKKETKMLITAPLQLETIHYHTM